MAKFNFKKGDTVEVIAGDDKGTKAEVLQVMPKKNKVIVKGVRGRMEREDPDQGQGKIE